MASAPPPGRDHERGSPDDQTTDGGERGDRGHPVSSAGGAAGQGARLRSPEVTTSPGGEHEISLSGEPSREVTRPGGEASGGEREGGPARGGGWAAADELERIIAAGLELSIEAEIALYEQEAELAKADPGRAARLLYELARLRERQGNLREAGKVYTQSLTSDPSLQVTTWALFRLFTRRGAWENLLRLLEAELRFAPLPTAADRADLLVEKGRLLEDRLGREAEARAAYHSALELDRAHPGALLALLTAALRADALAEAQEALRGLVQVAEDPTLRALFAVELAHLERGALTEGGDPGRLRKAADTLFRALLAQAAEEPICDELDRLSLAADDPELRSRVLDLLDSRLAREEAPWRADRPLLVALHREKARVLARRGAREAALAVLERGLRAAPGHPLLIADLLDVAEAAGRPDTIAEVLQGPGLGPGSYRRDEALLRRAEAAGRAGALGEAMGSLDQLVPEGPLAPLAELARMRILARLGDGDGLSRLFEQQAEKLAERTGEAPGAAREAAHLLVRAAIIRLEQLDDPPSAEVLLARALELSPAYPPARETLRAALVELHNWQALAELYEREMQLATDPELRRRLAQSLLLLRRDLLRDGEAAARLEAELGPSGDELAVLVRAADQAGDRFAATGEGAEELIRLLRTTGDRAEQPALAASLRLLAARVAAEAGAERAALALAEESFRCLPTAGAGGELERQYRRAGRHEEAWRVLETELQTSEQAGRSEVVRSLRFRVAQAALEAGRVVDALAVLAPLRERHDRLAVLWSWELAAGAARPDLVAAVLGEAASATVIDELRPAARLLALAEAQEEAGDSAAAAATFAALLDGVGQVGPLPAELAAAAALGRFRVEGGGAEDEGQRVRAFAALVRVWERLPGVPHLRPLADLLALATGVALTDQGPGEGVTAAGGRPSTAAALGRWLNAARAGDVLGASGGLEELAEVAQAEAQSEPEGPAAAAASALFATAAVRALLAGRALPASLARGGAGPLAELVEVAVSDLGVRLGGTLGGLRRLRAERLAQEAGPEGVPLAQALLVEEAADLEGEGRGRDAAATYARALAVDPTSLEATEGLRRVVARAGRRRAAAAALVRVGALLVEPRRAAERFAEAALLFEEEGLLDDAGQAFHEVLRRVPDDDEAFHRLLALAERGNRPQTVEKLLSFKLGRTSDPAQRVSLYARRAEVRVTLGRQAEAVHDHRRILTLVPDRRASLAFLASAALSEERFLVAIPFFERALAAADGDPGDQLRLGLAAAHLGAGRPGDAQRVLREAVAADPGSAVARERLVALGLKSRDHDLAAEQLLALEELAEEPTARAAIAVRRGRLERDQRHDRQRALAAFRIALELEPLGDAAAELLATVGEASLSAEDTAVVNRVIGRLRHELDVDPLKVRPLECLRDLASLRALDELREVSAQLLTALGHGTSRGRSRELVRAVSLATLGAFGAPGERPGLSLLNEIWPHLSEGVARLFPAEPAELGAGRATRVAPGTDPRLAWAESASVALGIPSLVIHQAGVDELTVAAFDVPDSCLVVGRAVLAGDPQSRFRVARALALLRQRATVVDRIPRADLELAWAAAAYLASRREYPGFDPTAIRNTAKRLGKFLSRRELKSLEAYADAFSRSLEVADWREAVLRTGDRFGLLVSGDLAQSLQALTGRSGASAEPLRAPASLDLIHFALSERYPSVRREAGLHRP